MKTIIFLVFTIISSTIAFAQTNYYVSPTGSNSNNGSLSSPWQTIQYGLNQMSSSDVLHVFPGTYSEKISIPASGITVKNYSAVLPVIDATGITSQNAILHIGNRSDVMIDGLEFRNNIQNDAQGILIDGSGANITVKNCVIHDIHFSSNPNAAVSETTNAQGIIVFGTGATTAITNLKLLNNHLYNCRLGYSEGIAVNGNVDGFEISNNRVHDLTNIGIDVIGHEGTSPSAANDQARNGLVSANTIHHCVSAYATSGGIYIDGAKKIVVEKNTSYRNGYGMEVGCEKIGATTDSIIIRNNVFYDNEASGIALGGFDYPSGSGKVTRALIRNNTCYSNDYSNSGLGELYLSYSETCTIENNIFYTSSQNQLAYAELTQPSLYFDYNLVYSNGGNTNTPVDWNGTFYPGFSAFVSGSSTNSHTVFADPLLTSTSLSAPDFHIAANSPAVNAGNPTTTVASGETDYFSELRIEQTVIDCGADEFGTSLGIDEGIRNAVLVYPNPAIESILIQTDSPVDNYEIYNLTGEKVISGTGNGVIQVSGLKAGIYLISIYSGNFVSVSRFEKR
ncbi:hypothetical protein D3C87_269350 [compost metagenome]